MKENFYIGLVPEIASFVTGLDEVERLIGKGFVFHDAEIEPPGHPMPDDIDGNVYTRDVGIIQSYVGVMNKMVRR